MMAEVVLNKFWLTIFMFYRSAAFLYIINFAFTDTGYMEF